MSEALPGFEAFNPVPVEPVPAAAVILYRRAGSAVEVFWVHRGAKVRFAAGFYAFCGGRVDPADAEVPVAGASGFDAAIRAAAARELFEESGVLVARGADRLGRGRLEAHRSALLAKSVRFAEVLATERVALAAEDFPEAGRWITPPFAPQRYDARLFLVELPASQEPQVWPQAGELAGGGLIAPDAALARWRDGQALLHPPNLHALNVMASFETVEAALVRLRTPPHCPGHVAQRIEFQQGVRLLPLRTPTLPPATHTNCYLLGNRELVVVDPGAPDESEQAVLAEYLAGLRAEGMTIVAVVATHRHQDHVSGVTAVARRFGLPVWAHAQTASAVPFPVARALADGEEIVLAGEPPMRWRIVHTPGHAGGHLCLFDPHSRALVAGDMVSGVSTIVIDPPEGDMAVYLRSLELLLAIEPRTLYPAHGMVIVDGPGKLREYLAHRLHREELIVGALRDGARTVPEIVARAYADTHPMMHPVAERSALATLLKLVAEGRARRDGEAFALANA